MGYWEEQTMQTPLNNFVNQNDTVYHTLLGKDTVVFIMTNKMRKIIKILYECTR